jgi:hypothetical protein
MAAKIISGMALIVAVLAGCGSAASSAPSAASAKTAASTVSSCKQLYLEWKNGPAQSAAKQFTAAQTALSAAGSKQNNVSGITAAVEAEGQAAARLAAFPVPACADPGGYLAAVLSNVQTAAASAATADSVSELVEALTPLKAVPELENDFSIELKRTTGI